MAGWDGLQAVLDAAVDCGQVPFLVAMAADGEAVRWSGAAGDRAPGAPAGLDTVFRLYSMTKQVAATAAMILIDRGRLALDAPAAEVLPELAEVQVLEGFDAETPRLRPPRRPITARHLATHTSGFIYEMSSASAGQAAGAAILRYKAGRNLPPVLSGERAGFDYPLMFDPGESWAYGTGVDWLGMMVERIDGRRIDRFCQEEIFAPLGMTDTCFELDADRERRLAPLYVRGDGGLTRSDARSPVRPEVYGMGSCLYGTAPDYLRLLRMQLRGGELDGVRIVSEPLIRGMQANLIGDLALDTGFGFFPATRKGHALPYMRVEEDVPGMRAAGSGFWAGGANTHYWVDYRNDVAAVFMTQLFPFVDPQLMQSYAAFERTLYAMRSA